MTAIQNHLPDETFTGTEINFASEGFLWLVNTVVFHPRGYRLTMDASPDRTRIYGFALVGDGNARYFYDEDGEPTNDELFARVQAAFERAASDTYSPHRNNHHAEVTTTPDHLRELLTYAYERGQAGEPFSADEFVEVQEADGGHA